MCMETTELQQKVCVTHCGLEVCKYVGIYQASCIMGSVGQSVFEV